MIKPPSWSQREDAVLLVNAYADGELGPAEAREIEQRLKTDATLKAEYDRIVAVRAAIAAHIPKTKPSAGLLNRIDGIGAPALPAADRPRIAAHRFDWQQMAAAIVITAGLASSVTYLGLRPAGTGPGVAAMIAGHQRALLAPEPFEIASSDRHTVKPWFDSKLALSPKVVDLTDAGFPLAGGRADTIGSAKVPAIVYLRRKHVISVIAVPNPGGGDAGTAPSRATRDGYAALSWRGQDFDYSAISDVAESELQDFVTRWRAAAQAK